jgi:hypothetical protein
MIGGGFFFCIVALLFIGFTYRFLEFEVEMPLMFPAENLEQ